MYTPVNEYFTWLLDKIDDGDGNILIYQKALDILGHTPFEVRIRGDENRLCDGLKLRERFCKEFYINYELLDRNMDICSILEVMVALADRIEYQDMHDPDLGDRTSVWFWQMFYCLGLDFYTDNRFDEEAVNAIMKKFNERRYDRQGHGSLFCIQSPRIDMRREELWYQAQHWLIENYI